MPTYTYRCQKCGEEFERFQSMSDEPVKRCPECKGKVQRVFHPVGIVLKGSGFHRNDYRTPSKKSSSGGGDQSSGGESGGEKSSSSSGAGSSEGSSEKSSEKKSESKRSSGSEGSGSD